MDFDDFKSIFSSLSFVHLDMNMSVNTDEIFGNLKSFKWSCQKYHGTIEPNFSNERNFNDQFFINLKKVDSDDEENKVTLIISFIQKDGIENREKNRGQLSFSSVKIGVYKVPININYNSKISASEKFDLYSPSSKLITESK